MNENWEAIAEPAVAEDYGTVRVCDKFGSIAVYVKIGDGRWRATYVDSRTGQYLAPNNVVSDAVACGLSRIVYVPKTVV